MEAREILGFVWFSGRETIGMVLYHRPETKQLGAYIKAVKGKNQESDLKDIMDWGTKFPVLEAASLITKFGESRVDLTDYKKSMLYYVFRYEGERDGVGVAKGLGESLHPQIDTKSSEDDSSSGPT